VERRLAEGGGAAIGFLAGGILVLAFVFFVLGGGMRYRTICQNRHTGELTATTWHFSVLTWFEPLLGSVSRDEVCENETWTQYGLGEVPVVGGAGERLMSGPSNPSYYANRDEIVVLDNPDRGSREPPEDSSGGGVGALRLSKELVAELRELEDELENSKSAKELSSTFAHYHDAVQSYKVDLQASDAPPGCLSVRNEMVGYAREAAASYRRLVERVLRVKTRQEFQELGEEESQAIGRFGSTLARMTHPQSC
jgi:hypothetical protein